MSNQEYENRQDPAKAETYRRDSNKTDAEKQDSKEKLELIDLTEILKDYLRIFRRMWAWVLIFCILGAGIFYVRARLNYQPQYTASATFTINIQQEQQGMEDNSSVAFFDNAAAEQMAKTFPYILTSGVLKRKVAEDMGTSAVTGSIQASVAENTNLLTISVTDRDAERAYRILKSVVENYPEVAEVIVGKTYMEMLDETGIPPQPDNPKAFRSSAVKGAVLGFLLVALWAGLLVVTRRTIRKEADVRKWMHTKCLGSLPEIRQKRRSRMTEHPLVITEESVEQVMQEPLRIIRNKIEHHAREYENKVFLITSALAGEGKSTVAVNLALSLAQNGKKVALIDCDLRHPSDREILGLEKGDGLGELLEKKIKMRDCTIHAKDLGLSPEMKLLFIPGGKAMDDGSELLGTERMERVIETTKNWADYVILDSAPAGLLTDAVVLAQYADAAVFVVRKDFARVDYIMDGLEHLAESRVQIVGGILNGV